MNQRTNSDWGSLLGQMFGIPMPGGQPDQDGPIPADATVGGDGSGGAGGPGGVRRGPGIMETIATWSRRALIVLAVVAGGRARGLLLVVPSGHQPA